MRNYHLFNSCLFHYALNNRVLMVLMRFEAGYIAATAVECVATLVMIRLFLAGDEDGDEDEVDAGL